jgi:hypothetical protein
MVNINENESHKRGSQFLGFLPPGANVLVLSPARAGGKLAPPVMAIPIAELFVKHQPRQKQLPTPVRQGDT